MKTKYAALLIVLSVVLAMVACSDSGTKPVASAQPGVEEAVKTAVDAYIYGYPAGHDGHDSQAIHQRSRG